MRQPRPRRDAGGAVPAGETSLDDAVAAIRDPTRRRILLRFYDDPTPRTVDEVAAAAGVHRTVAFGHLEQLAHLGFLAVDRRRGGLGKPPNLYAPSGRGLHVQRPARQFSLLSSVLAAAVADLPAATALVQDVARRSGAAQHRDADGRGLDAAVALIERLGGRPLDDGGGVLRARTCVFRESCVVAPPVVCGAFAALLEGALDAAGTPVTVVPLGSDSEGGCRYRLQEMTGGGP